MYQARVEANISFIKSSIELDKNLINWATHFCEHNF